MGFSESVRTAYSKYVTFSGRATRSEYWWFTLFYTIVVLVLVFVDSTMFGTVRTDATSFSASTETPILTSIFVLTTALPMLAVVIRRLHDTDHTGWWLLISFVPIIGGIVLLVFYVTDGTRGANRFGPDPKGRGTTGFGGNTGAVYTSSDIPNVKRD
ncbi:MAG: DUF805 domain-containing protein [Rhodobacterales bacterium]|nr:MAG: DUF805 domain-containing protein [Rhodobacterales bacterium]